MNPKTKSIVVVPYDPKWPQMFEVEAAAIKDVLTENCIAIQHVGSTSVPGLAAKPVIDIIAALKDPLVSIYPLETLGYTYKGEYNIPFRHYFNRGGDVQVNLHVYEAGHPEIELNVMFRDYLRTHTEVRDAYAALKERLLKDPVSLEKQGMFTGYNLGKNDFITKVLNQAGFDRLRMMRCVHHAEWAAAKDFRQKYFFDSVPVSDPYTWTFDHPDHVHFVLYKGTVIVGYAHIQRWPNHRAALRIIVIDEGYRNLAYGTQFLHLCETWLKLQGVMTLHVDSSPAALAFYQKHAYVDMPFGDPDGYERYPQDISVGKIL